MLSTWHTGSACALEKQWVCEKMKLVWIWWGLVFMDEGHECTLGLYLCIGVIQKAGLTSKQRQGKVLNIYVEYLLAKADQLRQVHRWVQVYTKRTDHRQKNEEKNIYKKWVSDRKCNKGARSLRQILEGRQVKLQTNKQINKFGELYNLTCRII